MTEQKCRKRNRCAKGLQSAGWYSDYQPPDFPAHNADESIGDRFDMKVVQKQLSREDDGEKCLYETIEIGANCRIDHLLWHSAGHAERFI
jgi:hypothetical protein